MRISYDEGQTWKKNFIIAKSENDKRDYSAYSDIVNVSKKEIGIIYEKEGYSKIVFTTVKWK